MTVIAFRPRVSAVEHSQGYGDATSFTGSFRSPRGRAGTMRGHLRLQRLVIVPRGVFVTGVFTGELSEPDGTVIGVDSRRCTVAADLRRDEGGLRAVVRPMQLDLMGITVDVTPFDVEPSAPFPPAPTQLDRRRRRTNPPPARIQPR